MYGREAGGTDDGGDDGDLFFYDHQLDLNTFPPVQVIKILIISR